MQTLMGQSILMLWFEIKGDLMTLIQQVMLRMVVLECNQTKISKKIRKMYLLEEEITLYLVLEVKFQSKVDHNFKLCQKTRMEFTYPQCP